jgi:small-conductance mechanosensitive channel
MTEFLGVEIPLTPWVLLPLVLLAVVILAYLSNAFILWVIGKVLQKFSLEIGQRISRPLELYLFPFLFVMGLLFIEDEVHLPVKILLATNRFLTLIGILLAIFLLAKASLIVLRNLESRYAAVNNIKGPIEVFVRILFIAVGGMLILDNLGISLTPIITTLGIGSLAVAIALQDTLGNFFAGLHLKADRPIEPGHYVRLESGQEGFVERVGWRSTSFRTLQNNTVVVPNSKLAQSIITNLSLPEERITVSIPIAVSYQADPQKIEEILLDEVKRAVPETEGLLDHPEPAIRFIPGFGDFSLNFTLICHVRRYADQGGVQHELRKKILKRFEKEGIEIPFPIRTVYLKGEAANKKET